MFRYQGNGGGRIQTLIIEQIGQRRFPAVSLGIFQGDALGFIFNMLIQFV